MSREQFDLKIQAIAQAREKLITEAARHPGIPHEQLMIRIAPQFNTYLELLVEVEIEFYRTLIETPTEDVPELLRVRNQYLAQTALENILPREGVNQALKTLFPSHLMEFKEEFLQKIKRLKSFEDAVRIKQLLAEYPEISDESIMAELNKALERNYSAVLTQLMKETNQRKIDRMTFLIAQSGHTALIKQFLEVIEEHLNYVIASIAAGASTKALPDLLREQKKLSLIIKYVKEGHIEDWLYLKMQETVDHSDRELEFSTQVARIRDFTKKPNYQELRTMKAHIEKEHALMSTVREIIEALPSNENLADKEKYAALEEVSIADIKDAAKNREKVNQTRNLLRGAKKIGNDSVTLALHQSIEHINIETIEGALGWHEFINNLLAKTEDVVAAIVENVTKAEGAYYHFVFMDLLNGSPRSFVVDALSVRQVQKQDVLPDELTSQNSNVLIGYIQGQADLIQKFEAAYYQDTMGLFETVFRAIANKIVQQMIAEKESEYLKKQVDLAERLTDESLSLDTSATQAQLTIDSLTNQKDKESFMPVMEDLKNKSEQLEKNFRAEKNKLNKELQDFASKAPQLVEAQMKLMREKLSPLVEEHLISALKEARTKVISQFSEALMKELRAITSTAELIKFRSMVNILKDQGVDLGRDLEVEFQVRVIKCYLTEVMNLHELIRVMSDPTNDEAKKEDAYQEITEHSILEIPLLESMVFWNDEEALMKSRINLPLFSATDLELGELGKNADDNSRALHHLPALLSEWSNMNQDKLYVQIKRAAFSPAAIGLINDFRRACFFGEKSRVAIPLPFDQMKVTHQDIQLMITYIKAAHAAGLLEDRPIQLYYDDMAMALLEGPRRLEFSKLISKLNNENKLSDDEKFLFSYLEKQPGFEINASTTAGDFNAYVSGLNFKTMVTIKLHSTSPEINVEILSHILARLEDLPFLVVDINPAYMTEGKVSNLSIKINELSNKHEKLNQFMIDLMVARSEGAKISLDEMVERCLDEYLGTTGKAASKLIAFVSGAADPVREKLKDNFRLRLKELYLMKDTSSTPEDMEMFFGKFDFTKEIEFIATIDPIIAFIHYLKLAKYYSETDPQQAIRYYEAIIKGQASFDSSESPSRQSKAKELAQEAGVALFSVYSNEISTLLQGRPIPSSGSSKAKSAPKEKQLVSLEGPEPTVTQIKIDEALIARTLGTLVSMAEAILSLSPAQNDTQNALFNCLTVLLKELNSENRARLLVTSVTQLVPLLINDLSKTELISEDYSKLNSLMTHFLKNSFIDEPSKITLIDSVLKSGKFDISKTMGESMVPYYLNKVIQREAGEDEVLILREMQLLMRYPKAEGIDAALNKRVGMMLAADQPVLQAEVVLSLLKYLGAKNELIDLHLDLGKRAILCYGALAEKPDGSLENVVNALNQVVNLCNTKNQAESAMELILLASQFVPPHHPVRDKLIDPLITQLHRLRKFNPEKAETIEAAIPHKPQRSVHFTAPTFSGIPKGKSPQRENEVGSSSSASQTKNKKN